MTHPALLALALAAAPGPAKNEADLICASIADLACHPDAKVFLRAFGVMVILKAVLTAPERSAAGRALWADLRHTCREGHRAFLVDGLAALGGKPFVCQPFEALWKGLNQCAPDPLLRRTCERLLATRDAGFASLADCVDANRDCTSTELMRPFVPDESLRRHGGQAHNPTLSTESRCAFGQRSPEPPSPLDFVEDKCVVYPRPKPPPVKRK